MTLAGPTVRGHRQLVKKWMPQGLGEGQPASWVKNQHLPDQVEHLFPILRAAELPRYVAVKRFAVRLDVSSVGRLIVPNQSPAGAEIFDLGAVGHLGGQAAKDPLHHGQVLPILVSLEQCDAQRQLEDDATDGPHIAGLGPAQLHDHLRRAVVPRGDNCGVVLVVEGGASKINQSNLGVANPPHLPPQGRIKTQVEGGVKKENVLRL